MHSAKHPVVLMSSGMDSDGLKFEGRLAYVEAVAGAGGAALVVPPGQDKYVVAGLCELAEAILIPGGVDVDPQHYDEEPLAVNGRVEPLVDEVDLLLARYALSSGKPLLAICRGCQVMNVAAGGSLVQDLIRQNFTQKQHYQNAPRWHATHHIDIVKGSLLHRVLGTDRLLVNSFHHQAVHTTGRGLVVTAQATDGVIEAIECPSHPFALGVQWHPEAMISRSTIQQRLFKQFIAAAKGRSGRKDE